MRIIITGTPGVGKTSVAKKLSEKLNVELIDVKRIINKVKAFKVNEFGEREILMPKFRDALKKELKDKKNWIIESHLICEIKIKADFVFVLRCSKKELEKRLKKRKYRKQKIEDNLMVELLDYCYIKAKKNNSKDLFELDTTKKSISRCVKDIVLIIKGKKKELDSVDHSKELLNFVTKR